MPRHFSKSAQARPTTRSRRALPVLLALTLGAGAVQAQAPEVLPPSPITGQGPFAGLERQPWDRLELEHRIDGSFYWSRISGGLGSGYTTAMRWRQPLGNSEHLVELEIPFRWTNYEPLSSARGVGDVRLQYYWMGRARREGDGALRGWAPTLNVVVPTGQEEKGLGFGNWLLMPGLTTTHRLSETWKLQTTLSYVQSLAAVIPAGHPEIIIPTVKGTALKPQDVQGLWLEPRFLVEPRGWLVDWFTATPDVIANFDGQQKSTMTAKFEMGRVLTPNFALNAMVWFPLNAENSPIVTLWGFGISLYQ